MLQINFTAIINKVNKNDIKCCAEGVKKIVKPTSTAAASIQGIYAKVIVTYTFGLCPKKSSHFQHVLSSWHHCIWE